jgi:hypothetical protein
MKISFAAEAVHLPSHPEYGAFSALWKEQRAPARGFRWRTNLE